MHVAIAVRATANNRPKKNGEIQMKQIPKSQKVNLYIKIK